MTEILKLNVTGQPTGWLSVNEAVSAYARNDILYGIGNTLPPILGGIQRASGLQSRVELQPIIALTGIVYTEFTPTLCNYSLFRRDDYRCIYCGNSFTKFELTRDHIQPLSRGGKDSWENVVAACKRCNFRKGNKTPEEANMPLRENPFIPNSFEWHFLSRENLMSEQMSYLSTQFKAQREWAERKAA